MTLSAATLWLLAGVVFMAIEAFGVPGVGLLFAGLGAITAGAAISLGLVAEETTLVQYIIFFASSSLWALLLWKPLKKWRTGKTTGGYSNMVGDTAYVGSSGLEPGREGEVTWSGTIMRARLSEGNARVDGGAQVIITDVQGVTLTVRPK